MAKKVFRKTVATLLTPRPYREGWAVRVGVGKVGMTKVEIPGRVITVLPDWVTVIAGGKSITFQHEAEETVIE